MVILCDDQSIVVGGYADQRGKDGRNVVPDWHNRRQKLHTRLW